jgi:hypothetical protein
MGGSKQRQVAVSPIPRGSRVSLKTGSGDEETTGRHIGTVTATGPRGEFTVTFDGRRESGQRVRGGRFEYQPYQAEAFIVL